MDKDKSAKKQPENEEEEDIKIEKPSYTYWKRDADKAADHTQFQPQQAAGKVEENTIKIGSAWNQAGTWEEKHINKNQLEEFFNVYLSKNKKIYKDSFSLKSINAYSGDTYFIYSKGKIKFFYDCEMKVVVNGENNFKGETTEWTLKEVSNADLDDNFEFEFESVTQKENAQKFQLIKIVKGNVKDVQKTIRGLFDEMKADFMK